MQNVIDLIIDERRRQDKKWGEQNHDDWHWLAILTEEVGEVAKAMLDLNPKQIYKELIETAAVVCGMA